MRASWQRRALLATIVALAIAQMRDCVATSIEIDLGNPGTLSVHKKVSFNALNGMLLMEQPLSLEFNFSNNEFVRLFSITSLLFSAEIDLHTNGVGQLGTLQGTGHLVDINGQPIPGFGVTGNSSGDDGSLSIGFFPLLKDQNGTPDKDLARPLDFFGIEFDLTVPDVQDPSIHVTGAEFRLVSDPDRVFGIGPGVPRDIVPDFGGTLLLFTIAFGSLITAKRL